uniref:Nramp transporter n=1 Tax=Arundo donax TaxID=35708 RepID=A0A0A9EGX2_ARUDO
MIQRSSYLYCAPACRSVSKLPGSIYAIETRNPGPVYENKFFQLVFSGITI